MRFTTKGFHYESGSPMARLQELEDKIEDGVLKEVRLGKWIEYYGFKCWHYDCPFCDDGFAIEGRETTPPNYCSNCGAKLDGKESDIRG